MYSVHLSEAATAELGEAYLWYESREGGLGEDLLAEFRRVGELIGEAPLRFPLVEGSIRRARLRRFPFSVYFRVVEQEIIVIAFFHGRRDPAIWRRRE